MNWYRLPLACFCIILFSIPSWGQIQLKLEPMPDASTYGVYLQLCEEVVSSGNTITGSGQVTVVYPAGLQFGELTSVSGLWQGNSSVVSPVEAVEMSYISIGFVVDNPQIVYQSDEPTLLFTFKLTGSTGGLPYLIDNESDPFNQLPNSVSSNPGNELSAIDIGAVPTGFFHYSGNFTGAEMNCDEIPQDTSMTDTTIVVNTDTTGQGGENPTATLEELAAQKLFTLTPNPAHIWINVVFNEEAKDKTGTLRFWSASGIPLGEMGKTQEEKMALNIGALPAGLYFLSFESDGEVLQRERFLKQ